MICDQKKKKKKEKEKKGRNQMSCNEEYNASGRASVAKEGGTGDSRLRQAMENENKCRKEGKWVRASQKCCCVQSY